MCFLSLGKDSLLDFSCLENFSPQDGRKGPDTAQLQLQLQQTQQLADWYREQSIKCEDELGRVKEESKYKESCVCTCTRSLIKLAN